MLDNIGHMSIWELAHRWVDADPMVPAGTPIPLAVQPILRALSYAVATGSLYAARPDCFAIGYVDPNDPDPQCYAVFDRRWNEKLEVGQLASLLSSSPNRDVLDGIYVSLDDAFYWAVRRDEPLDFPGFIIPPEARPKGQTNVPRDDVQPVPGTRRPQGELLDKAGAQGAALALWSEHPEMPIAQVCEHPAFLQAGGRNYNEVTRSNWARNVAPDGVKNRPGRPRGGN
jgi:hypothetical protein